MYVKPDFMNGMQNHLQLIEMVQNIPSLCEIHVFHYNKQHILDTFFAVHCTCASKKKVFSIIIVLCTDKLFPC
jgi:hypothetical protein